MKRTRLERTTPMVRTSELPRTGPPRAVSAKRRRVNLVRAALAHEHLGALCRIPTPVCTRDAEHFHELVSRAQGGSLTDRRNLVPCADTCNSWLEDNPQEAYDRGWKVRRQDAMPGDGGLVPAVPSPLAIANDQGSWT